MLDTIITSKTRIKLLMKFFLNSDSTGYLRNLESEFSESTNAIRIELNRFEDAGLLNSEKMQNRKYYKANTSHPLFKDINSILMKYTGLDAIIETVIEKIGELNEVYVTGDFARGLDSNIVDLIFVCEKVNRSYLSKLITKAETLINRKIKYVILNEVEFDDYKLNLSNQKLLLLWKEDSVEVSS